MTVNGVTLRSLSKCTREQSGGGEWQLHDCGHMTAAWAGECRQDVKHECFICCSTSAGSNSVEAYRCCMSSFALPRKCLLMLFLFPLHHTRSADARALCSRRLGRSAAARPTDMLHHLQSQRKGEDVHDYN